ncbi:MAG: hypothetical protein HZA72_00205 [Candidatus Omnitrophica bacterium]|nr:hypothetical protein [Candidatus Omnitrophota bacterium]
MKRFIICVLPCLLLSFTLVMPSFCEANKAPAKKAKPEIAAAKAPEKEMTKEEMVNEIKDILTEEDEILGLIQGLKSQKDPAGKVSYSYNGVGLENISKDELSSLLSRARQMATKLRTERIQNQMEAVRQVDRLKAVSAPHATALPASPPRPPGAPSQPPSAPRTPPPPAQPPRR